MEEEWKWSCFALSGVDLDFSDCILNVYEKCTAVYTRRQRRIAGMKIVRTAGGIETKQTALNERLWPRQRSRSDRGKIVTWDESIKCCGPTGPDDCAARSETVTVDLMMMMMMILHVVVNDDCSCCTNAMDDETRSSARLMMRLWVNRMDDDHCEWINGDLRDLDDWCWLRWFTDAWVTRP